jgi:HK97 family phage major capsid protein
MAMTKTEAAKLTNDLLLRGVIETIVKESELLARLPFMEVTGTAVTYNREATMPAAGFYEVGDTWTEATPTFTQVTANLKIMGGDADVDNFVQATYADPNDIEAEVISNRAKAIAHLYSESFFNGDSGINVKSFDGLTKVLDGTAQEVSAGNERRAADARPDGPDDRPGEARQAGRAVRFPQDAAESELAAEGQW